MGKNIQLDADIDLDNKTLSIEEGTTITIDLNGHTLDRKLTKRGEGGGQVFTVRSGATLNLSNGTLKGGWGGNSGGISNEGGTANLTNVTITGCTGDDRGGGISNLSGSTLNMEGGAITNNKSNDHNIPTGGGGIFNAEGATATLTNVTITGNETTIYGGISMEHAGTFTSGYSACHNDVSSTFFSEDNTNYNIILLDGEGCFSLDYLERSWDSENKKVVTTTKTLTAEIGFNDIPTNEYQYKVLTPECDDHDHDGYYEVLKSASHIYREWKFN